MARSFLELAKIVVSREGAVSRPQVVSGGADEGFIYIAFATNHAALQAAVAVNNFLRRRLGRDPFAGGGNRLEVAKHSSKYALILQSREDDLTQLFSKLRQRLERLQSPSANP